MEVCEAVSSQELMFFPLKPRNYKQSEELSKDLWGQFW